jgi:antitoxin component of MazEF toxin-antitoxin module
MTQKIIKVGSSAGILIPKKELQELGLGVGDEVKYSLEPVKKNKHAKLMKEYDAFVKQYGETLKNLADR